MLWRVSCVVSKGLDHTAIGNPAAVALDDHPFKLGFEHLQPVDATLNPAPAGAWLCDVCTENFIR